MSPDHTLIEHPGHDRVAAPRSRRACLATARQELVAPLDALLELTTLLIDDARERGPDEFVADLHKVRASATRLRADLVALLDPAGGRAAADPGETVRHALRSRLTPIIGFCDLWLEDAGDFLLDGFAPDLREVRDLGQRLLARVSDLAALVDAFPNGGRPPAAPESRPAARPAGDGRSETGAVLVVDDDPLNRELLSRWLHREGHSVDLACDGRQALDLVRARPFDLVLLDVVMPGGGGVQALEALKADERLRHLPVVVISACDDLDRAVRCIEGGAEDYLPKPFNPTLLKARVSACLEKKRLRDREVQFVERLQQEQRRSDGLLHVLLPTEAVRELKTTGAVRPRRREGVAVLFCDIVGFTAFCDRNEPEEVVPHLQRLIEHWEEAAGRHRVQKIKTVGDSFMAAAGLLETTAEHPVLHCVRCGLDLIAAARELRAPWEVRVGIHFGPVVAGVIGCRQYLFDLWGDTVNTAARVESHGRPGAVVLSTAAWEPVAGRCRGTPLGRIDVKGKGPMEMVRFESFLR
jgi:class 3 adenylate cyclase